MKEKVQSFIKKHPDVISILMIALATALFFSRQLFLHKILLPVDILLTLSPWSAFYSLKPYNHIISDIVRQGYPWLVYLTNSVKSGHLPLWNPLLLCGMPSPTAFFPLLYPFMPLLLLGPLKHSFGYFIMLHIFLAGVFTYAFLRDIELEKIPAIAGAFTFMFCQVLIHWSESIINPASMIWLPLELLLVNRIVKRGKISYAVLLAGVVTINFYTGMLQFFYYSSLAVFAYALFLLYLEWKDQSDLKYSLKIFGFFCLSFIILLGLSAVQLLPTLELGKFILRTGESSDYVAGSVQDIRQVITFLIPNFFGNPVRGNPEWNMNLEWFMNSGYLGILPLFLAMIGAFFSSRKQRTFFLGLAIITFLLSFDPLINKILYYLIPLYNRFRSVSRWLPIYAFSISILCGFGLDFLLYADKDRNTLMKVRRYIALLSISMIFVVIFVLFKSLPLDPPLKYHIIQIIIFMILLAASIFLILSLLNTKNKRALYAYFIVIIIVLDGFIFNFTFYPALDPSLAYPKTPALEFLTNDKSLYRIVRYENQPVPTPITPTLTPSSSMAYGIQDIQGSSVFVVRRYAEYLNLIEDQGDFASFDEIPSIIKTDSLNSKLLDAMNVKYVLSVVPIKNDKFSLVYDNEIKIYKNNEVLPRAYIVYNWITAKNSKEAKKALKKDDFDPKTTAVVEDTETLEELKDTNSKSYDKVEINKYDPTEIEISVKARDKALLFLADTYYPGWQVYVDGKTSKIHRANHNFRAVFLDRGSHKVRFVFCPSSLRTGGIISSLTLIACIGLLFFDLFWRRKKLK